MEYEEKILNDWAKALKEGGDESAEKFFSDMAKQKEQEFQKNVKDNRQKVFETGGYGIVLGCMSFLHGVKGHYELTEYTFKKFEDQITSNPACIKNFARASRLPDLLFFDDLVYHAQTKADKNNIPIDKTINFSNSECQNFIQHLKSHLNLLDKAIKEENLSSIYYYVGILFHGIQDLSAHQGMTNPEHSYWNKKKKSPDCVQERYILGEKICEEFMLNFLLSRLKPLTKLFDKATEFPWNTYETIKNKCEVILKGIKFEFSCLSELKEDNQVRWFKWIPEKDKTKKHYDDVLFNIKSNIFSKLS